MSNWTIKLLMVICLFVSVLSAQDKTVRQPLRPQKQLVTHAPSIATSGILLFNGLGTSADVQAVEAVLSGNLHLTYDTVDSPHLDAMTQAQLSAYKLFIIPGGDSIIMGQHLTANTMSKIRNAVQVDGLHYLGICAGAFLSSNGGGTYNDIDLLHGIWFDMYGETKEPAVERLTRPNNQVSMDVYWEDGPSMTPQGGTWGTIVAKYPNGQSAIIQGTIGKGYAVLLGLHPEAPAGWRSCTGCVFTTTLANDLAFAGTLISAALNGTVLPHY